MFLKKPSFEKKRNSKVESLRAPHFGEPGYGSWPMLADEQLQAVRTGLRQSLASVLNAPGDAPFDEYDETSIAEGTLLQRQQQQEREGEEEADERVLAVSRFFATRRVLAQYLAREWSSFSSPDNNDDDDDEKGSGEELPALFCESSFRVRSACADDGSLSPLHLQQLSHLLDVAEGRLVRETAARSSAFFSALLALRGLDERAAAAVGRVRVLRAGLGVAGAGVAGPGVALAGLARRRENAKAVLGLLNVLREGAVTGEGVEKMLREGKVVEAMEEEEKEGEEGKEGEKRNEGEDVGVDKWRLVAWRASREERRTRLMAAAGEEMGRLAAEGEREGEEGMLERLARAMGRAGEGTAAWEIVGARVGRYGEEKEQGKGEKGAVGLSLSSVLTGMEAALGRLERAAACEGSEAARRAASSAEEAMEARAARLVRGRSDELARQRVEDFEESFRAVAKFGSSRGRGGFVLAQQGLARAFVEHLHRGQCASIGAVLDSERWSAVAVPAEFQKLADFMTGEPGKVGGGDNESVLRVGGESYRVVFSALALLQSSAQYVQCARVLNNNRGEEEKTISSSSSSSSSSGEALSGLAKLLRLFNSKCALLLLGAEAVGERSGLRAISAKHLALCAESLSAAEGWLSRVEFPDKSAVMGEFAAHRCDLEEQVAAIMRGVATGGVGAEVVAEKTRALFRVLAGAMRRTARERVWEGVWRAYRETMSEEDLKQLEGLRDQVLGEEQK